LLKGINDSPLAAKRLISLLRGLECKVNVIPYNEIGGEFNRPNETTIQNFLKELKVAPFNVTVRWSKGTDINAGCGQLAVLSNP
jgi:23S rRNA (adenine2503-C2)-methyltransferase